jgi:hypothetical protein
VNGDLLMVNGAAADALRNDQAFNGGWQESKIPLNARSTFSLQLSGNGVS